MHTWSLAVEEQFHLVFPSLLSVFLYFVRGRVFATVNGDAGSAPVDEARLFFETRKRWITDWKQDVIFVIERWDRTECVAAMSRFDEDLRQFAEASAPSTQKLVLFSQPPVLQLGESENLRRFITWKIESTGAAPVMLPDRREGIRADSARVLEEFAAEHPQVEIIRADRVIRNEAGSVRYSAGRSSRAGRHVARLPFQRILGVRPSRGVIESRESMT